MPLAVDTFYSLVIFALVSSVTPGPNNFMLLSSGVNFGFRRTIPHMLGIAGGFFSLLVGVGLGLGTLLKAFPVMELGLKIAGGSYLLYLAYKTATSRKMAQVEGASQPMSFMAAAMFQWVNPKAWVMAITAMAIFTNGNAPYASVAIVAVVFTAVNLPSVSIWTGFGTSLRRWLADPVRLKWFNIAMGLALALTIIPMVG